MPSVCAQCATDLPDGAAICVRCGAAVETPSSAAYVPSFSMGKDLEGLGGWLILVAIGLALSPLSCVHGMIVDLRVLYGSSYQIHLSAHPGLAALVLYEAATNTIFLVAIVALNLLFYLKKKAFPFWMISYLACHLVLILFDHIAALRFYPHSSPTSLLESLVGTAIWIPYYLRSERVKATFTR
jgi:hypothetical protein